MRALGAFLLPLAVTAGAFAYTDPGAAASRRAACPPAGATVLARDRVVRVYSPAKLGPFQGGVEACTTNRSGHMTLALPGRHLGLAQSLSRFALSSTTLAYVANQWGVDSGTFSIVVVDVARRRRLQDLGAVGYYVDAGFVAASDITDLLVAADGSVAWIVGRGRRNAAKTFAVLAAAPSHPTATLDEGPGIGPGSLTLSHGTLSWWHDGAERRAALP